MSPKLFELGNTRTRHGRWITGAAIAVMSLHGGLLGWGAWIHSPCWDELGHLPAGISHWTSGRFDLYRVNPPLVRMVAALPVLGFNINVDWRDLSTDGRARPEWECGRSLVKSHGERVFWCFTLARWACLPFGLLGAWLCFRWASALYGMPAGLTALTLWCFSPAILGNGQMITPDTAAAALGGSASYMFWWWLREPRWTRALGSGVVLGLTELTKFTWIVLFGLWPLLWLVWRASRARLGGVEGRTGAANRNNGQAGRVAPDRPTDGVGQLGRRHASTCQHVGSWWGEFAQLFVILSSAIYVINLGYGFEGTGMRLGEFRFVSQTLGSRHGQSSAPYGVGNRVTGTPWAGVRIPLPVNYVLGIDRQRLDFESRFWSYLRGEWREGGWWYYYLYGLVIKEPLGTWALALLALTACVLGRGYAAEWRAELMLVAPIVVVLALVSSQTGFNHHVRYVLPVFPFAFIWMSKVARSFELGHRAFSAVIASVLLWVVGSSLYHYPHSLSYFNELVGGPMHGHKHLLDSNVDWGQDLLLFKRWIEKHREAKAVGLAYSLPKQVLDPADVGIDYTLPPPGPDTLTPFLAERNTKLGPLPGWYAVFVRAMRERHRRYAYFEQFEPVEMLGYTVRIYHISVEDASRVRRKLGLPEIHDSKGTRLEESQSPRVGS